MIILHLFLRVFEFRKLLLTHIIKLRHTSKIRNFPSVVNCREFQKPAAVNYRGKPQQLTTAGSPFLRQLTVDAS